MFAIENAPTSHPAPREGDPWRRRVPALLGHKNRQLVGRVGGGPVDEGGVAAARMAALVEDAVGIRHGNAHTVAVETRQRDVVSQLAGRGLRTRRLEDRYESGEQQGHCHAGENMRLFHASFLCL